MTIPDENAPTYYQAAQEANLELISHLLCVQLRPALQSAFSSTRPSALTFEDSLHDFLLFLYHGPEYMRSAGLPPFSMMLRIRNVQSLFSWTISAYRLFLLQQERAVRFIRPMPSGDSGHDPTALCNAIATCWANGNPMGRFLLCRWLLGVLEPDLAIAQEPMAHAAGISHSSYRMGTSRQKKKLQDILLTKPSSVSDPELKRISSDLLEHIDSLYDCIKGYYCKSIAALPQSKQIHELIDRLSFQYGRQLHEDAESK